MKKIFLSLALMVGVSFAFANTTTNMIKSTKAENVATFSTNLSNYDNALGESFSELPAYQKEDIVSLIKEYQAKINSSETIQQKKFWCWLLGEAVQLVCELAGMDPKVADSVGDAIQTWCESGFNFN